METLQVMNPQWAEERCEECDQPANSCLVFGEERYCSVCAQERGLLPEIGGEG